jgi:pimeloyl-ACP methyl ester carboxylesterase
MKRWLKRIGITLIALILLLYVIPTDFSPLIPQSPYANSRFIPVGDNITLHTQVEDTDRTQGKVLLIHGFMASTYSYRHVIPQLKAAGYAVVAVDLPSFGYSTKSTSAQLTQVNFATWLSTLLSTLDDEWNDDRPWRIVGHSMGASTAITLADRYPQHVESLTLIAPAINNQGNPSIGWLLYTPVGQGLKVALKYALLTPSNFKSLLSGAMGRTPTDDEVRGYLDPFQVRGAIDALVRYVQTAKNTTIDNVSFNLPVYVTWGDQDTWVSVDNLLVIEEQLNVVGVKRYPTAGHLPHETEASFTSDLVLLWELEQP